MVAKEAVLKMVDCGVVDNEVKSEGFSDSNGGGIYNENALTVTTARQPELCSFLWRWHC